MAVWGISLLCLALTYLIHRHPPNTWRISWLRDDGKRRIEGAEKQDVKDEARTEDKSTEKQVARVEEEVQEKEPPSNDTQSASINISAPPAEQAQDMDEEKTPLATPAAPSLSVPSFTLDSDDMHPAPSFPAANSPQRAQPSSTPSNDAILMPPPPKPSSSALMPPPSFPAPNSAQRASSGSSLMPPPGRPTPRLGVPSRGPPPSAASQARAAPRIDTPKSRGSKVQLAPGYSPLDWASLAASKNLANVPGFQRVTPSALAKQNGRRGTDAWSAYKGKVYNITPYLPFHPGGQGELLRGAGKDGTKMFLEVHPWVNWEGMLNSCLVGVLVSEAEGEGLEGLD